MPVVSLLATLEDFEGAVSLVDYSGGQGSSTTDDNPIEGTLHGGRRVDNATAKGFGVQFAATDLSTAGEHVRSWLNCSQWPSVTRVLHRLSSGADDDHELPTGEFPALGGYLPMWTDVSRTPEVGGAANLAAISEVGVLIDIGNVGGNSLNLQIDKISHGTSGLRWTGTGGTLAALEAFDSANAEGVVVRYPSGATLFFAVEIGDGTTPTSFTHDTKLTAASQPLVAQSAAQLTVDLTLAGDTFTGANGGSLESDDPAGSTNRPAMTFVGTLGTATLEPGYSLLGLADLTLTSAVTINGGTYDAVNIAHGGALIVEAVVRTRAAAGVACVADADLALLGDVDFTQTGLGHAIEINTPGTYNIDSFTFTGYGADEALDAAILNSSGGAVTLTRTDDGVPAPTVRNTGGSTTSIPAVQAQVTFADLPLGAEFRIYDDDADGIVQTIGTPREGTESLAASTYVLTHDTTEAGDVIWVQLIAPGVFEEALEQVTLASVSQTRTLTLTPEENL